MKIKYFIALLFIPFSLFAQRTVKDYAVLLQAKVVESPASITITWDTPDTTCQGYVVYRKAKKDASWGIALANYDRSITQYVDHSVTVGVNYDYYVQRVYTPTWSATGYISAGIKLPEVTSRGRMLLLVDANYVTSLSNEINQLQLDLIADGWRIKKINVSRTASVTAVKAIIAGEYKADTTTNALYLLGRIPVPYSGAFRAVTGYVSNPDGHLDHGGAWPADMYYGVMNESIWTDYVENDSSFARANGFQPEHWNIPNDGKFDICYIYPNQSALEIGRVDLTNMPSFGINDTLLTKQYLNKAHLFKTKQVPVVRRGLVNDNFGVFGGEAFASSGWRNFSGMFGDSVFSGPYFSSLQSKNYLFSYACGGGGYTGASGVGSTTDFASDSVKTIFTMMFGSYFGDWDSQDNFLRAPLCSKPCALASMWSGRPYWNLHHMAMGENIGYSARLAMNNYSFISQGTTYGYAYNYGPSFVHIDLMGDPSLRLHPTQPATNILSKVTSDSLKVNLTWNASPDATSGYVILRAKNINSPFSVLSKVAAGTFNYTDVNPKNGMNCYMVRALNLENTPSGTYYNLSLGITDSVYAKNTTSINQLEEVKRSISLYPNPNNGKFVISTELGTDPIQIGVFDMLGKEVYQTKLTSSITELDIPSPSKGIYFIEFFEQNTVISVKKVIVQ